MIWIIILRKIMVFMIIFPNQWECFRRNFSCKRNRYPRWIWKWYICMETYNILRIIFSYF